MSSAPSAEPQPRRWCDEGGRGGQNFGLFEVDGIVLHLHDRGGEMKAAAMSEKVAACVKCAAPLDQSATGRPKTYCGDGCRGAAAYEIRRINRRLEFLEGRLATLRHEPDRGYKDMHGRTRREQIDAFDAERIDAEVRIAALLGPANGIADVEMRAER